MSALDYGRYVMGICAALSILAACSGRAGGDSTASVPNVGAAVRHHQNFLYTGAKQTFTVPAGVTTVRIDAKGASGGGASGSQSSRVTAGPGGEVKATIPEAAAARTTASTKAVAVAASAAARLAVTRVTPPLASVVVGRAAHGPSAEPAVPAATASRRLGLTAVAGGSAWAGLGAATRTPAVAAAVAAVLERRARAGFAAGEAVAAALRIRSRARETS